MDRHLSSFISVNGDFRKELGSRYPEVVFRKDPAGRAGTTDSRRFSTMSFVNNRTPSPSFVAADYWMAGGAHPMTIALAPVPKVDYSVTKGGARTWAVLLVFMFLCSSLYTVFSAKEIAEMAVDMDGDGNLDLDDDLSDDLDEVAAQQRKIMKDTTPSSDEHRHGDRRHHDQTAHQAAAPTADDDDEDAPDELESQLFAGLRKKIEKNIKKVKEMVQSVTNDKEEEEQKEEEPVTKQPRARRRGKKNRDEEEEEKEVEVPQKKEKKRTPPPPPPPKKAEKEKKKTKVEVKEEEDDEEDEDEDDDEEEDDEKNGKEDDDDEEEEEEEKQDEVIEHNKEEDDEDIKADKQKKWDDDVGKDAEPQMLKRQQRKRHDHSHITAYAPDRECRRKHCPPAYAAEPRRSLLKKKKGDSTSSKRYHTLTASELETFEDDFDDEEEETEATPTEPEEPIQELVAVKKYRSSGRDAYKRHLITNKDDHRHRVELDRADFLVEKHEYDAALALFDVVLRVSPQSPRAHFGKARAYDIRSEYSADEHDMDLAIQGYEHVVDNDDTPEALFRQAASRLIERSRFRGHMHRCLQAQRTLIDRFPNEMELQTDFALTFLMMKRHDDARKIFRDVLEIDPNNAIALAYYGYILKVADHDIEGGVQYMRKGLRLGGEKIADAKFYYHLGHGLMYLGKTTEAYAVYEQGAELGLFLSAQQRSMYNVEGLTGRPWWSLDQTGYTKHLKSLERQWVSIRHEAVRALHDVPDSWTDENPTITVDGHWLSFNLMTDGQFVARNCERTPQTCAILEEFRDSGNASKTEMRFSVLSSGAQVLPHCGPSNTRLQAHMGLVVPSEARIRVGSEQRGWKTGKFIVFDDSFEHEMQFDGASSSAFRLVLVVDLWHPEVDVRERVEPSDS